MKQRIDIIGAGLGPDSLTQEAADLIVQADVLIGSDRLVAEHAQPDQTVVAASRPAEVVAAIKASSADRIAVLMSGDVGFYSGATKVWDALDRDRSWVRLVPGISAPVLLAARVGVPWQDANLVSCHGLDTDAVVARVRRHRLTIVLTGGNIPSLATALCAAGFGDLTVWVGQELGLPGEVVTETKVSQLGGRWPSLTTLLVENWAWDDRVLSGLPDDSFERADVPMTKSAVRAFSLSRLAPRPTDTCYDIGCGTGSVTVEMALAAHRGQVWAVDQNPVAVALTRQNCRAFHVANVMVSEGLAPDAIANWPSPHAAFIGGASGNLKEIVAAVVAKNHQARIVITAIAVETVAAAAKAIDRAGLRLEMTQLTVAQGRAVAGLHMLMGQNPVTVISGSSYY